MDTKLSRQGWIVLLGVPALFFVAYLLFLTPHLLNLPICAVKSFLGIDCPGCGLCHSFAFLTHGAIRKSICFHPLGLFIAIWLIYLFILASIELVLGRPLQPIFSQMCKDILIFIFLVALVGQWIIKLMLNILLY